MYYFAVEKGLDNVKDFLIQQGYNIDEFYDEMKHTPEYLKKYNAIITNRNDSSYLYNDTIDGSLINTSTPGINYGFYEDATINTCILNENTLTPPDNISGVPVINAHNSSPEEIHKKLRKIIK